MSDKKITNYEDRLHLVSFKDLNGFIGDILHWNDYWQSLQDYGPMEYGTIGTERYEKRMKMWVTTYRGVALHCIFECKFNNTIYKDALECPEVGYRIADVNKPSFEQTHVYIDLDKLETRIEGFAEKFAVETIAQMSEKGKEW